MERLLHVGMLAVALGACSGDHDGGERDAGTLLDAGTTEDAGAPDEDAGPRGEDAGPTGEPGLVAIEDFEYAGAFRLPADMYGVSELNYSEGPIEVDPEGGSIFIVGHAHQQALAEFAMPELVVSETLGDLEMAEAPVQTFTTVLDRVAGGNPQALDRIGGMKLVDGELLVHAYEYYDAPGDNTHTTAVVRDPDDLAGSTIDGFLSFEGGAHVVGWMSPIPDAWQDALGGPMLTGASSGIPIIGRASVGPSAFAFDPARVVGVASPPDPGIRVD